MKKTKKKIVVLGSGFAGMYSALSILKSCGECVEITIINRTNYFLFTPMLHEVATGGLGHHQVVESIRQVTYKTQIRFFEAQIESVDLSKKEVMTDKGSVPYDMLVVALGASTNFFGTEGAEEHSYVLKDLLDAIRIRDRVIDSFEAAAREKDMIKRKQLLSFVVVGGGATGVEYAAELAEFADRTLDRYYAHEFAHGERATITLVHSGSSLLGPYSVKTQARALQTLVANGIKVLLNTKVVKVEPGFVTLGDGQKIQSDTVVWAAGVRPNPLMTTGEELPKDECGRIATSLDLSVKGFTDVFAIGDIASVNASNGRPYPMLAQIAVAQARHLGKNISRALSDKPLAPFTYKQKGSLVSLGRWQAAGTLFGVEIYGKFAWFVWRTVYLFKFISGSKRLKIATDWTVGLFYPRDITRA